MTLAYPWVLVLLVVAIFPWLRKKRSIALPKLTGQGTKTWRIRFAFLPPLCASIGLTLLVFALSRPQKNDMLRIVEREGLDIMLVVDTSGSMESKDYSWEGVSQTRIAVAKKTIIEFVRSRPNDRLGVVVFGEEAFTQAPLSTDHEGLYPFLDQIQIGLAGEGATAIGDGMAIAAQRLKELEAESKIMIVLTDGASNVGSDPMVMAKACASLGIRVYTIGMGGEGASGLMGLLGVGAQIDEGNLATIASVTGGTSFFAKDSAQLQEVYQEIDRLETTTAEVSTYVLPEELFAPFVLPGIGIFGAGIFA